MKKIRLFLLIFAVLFVILLCYINNSWKSDNENISILSSIMNQENIILSITDSRIDKNLVHKLKYNSNTYINSRLIAIEKNGVVRTILKLNNVYIQNFLLSRNKLLLTYNSGKNMYKNKNNLIKYEDYCINVNRDLIKGNRKVIDKKIWGVDPVDNDLLIDQKNIEFESGLTSNILCTKGYRLYSDGNKMIKYNKSTKEKKIVYIIPFDDYYTDIGYMKLENRYILICHNQEGETRLILLDQNFEVIKQENIDFDFNYLCIGSEIVVMVNENNNIMCIDSKGNIKNISVNTPNQDNIISICYKEKEAVFYNITNNSIIELEEKNKTIGSLTKLSDRLHGIINNIQ